MINIDAINRNILHQLQANGRISNLELAEKVGLSQNACWRRLKALEESGIIRNHTVVIDRSKLGFGLVVFSMVKTRHHSSEWLDKFRRHVSNIPEVIDFFRIGGDYDYLLKIVVRDMSGYDEVYKRLIKDIELDTVTSYFAMEAIEEQRPLPIG